MEMVKVTGAPFTQHVLRWGFCPLLQGMYLVDMLVSNPMTGLFKAAGSEARHRMRS